MMNNRICRLTKLSKWWLTCQYFVGSSLSHVLWKQQVLSFRFGKHILDVVPPVRGKSFILWQKHTGGGDMLLCNDGRHRDLAIFVLLSAQDNMPDLSVLELGWSTCHSTIISLWYAPDCHFTLFRCPPSTLKRYQHAHTQTSLLPPPSQQTARTVLLVGRLINKQEGQRAAPEKQK